MIPIGPLRIPPHPDGGDVVVGEFASKNGGKVRLVESIDAEKALLLDIVTGVKAWEPIDQLIREEMPEWYAPSPQ